MPESPALNQEFADFLRALSAAEVQYLIVGGYALAAHGSPRATGDLDAWIERSAANAERTMTALRAFGAPLAELSAEDLATPDVVFQMGLPPRRLDILTSIDGVEFATAWPNRLSVEIDGLTVPVIGREDLLANKRASGRPQDLADIAALEGE